MRGNMTETMLFGKTRSVVSQVAMACVLVAWGCGDSGGGTGRDGSLVGDGAMDASADAVAWGDGAMQQDASIEDVYHARDGNGALSDGGNQDGDGRLDAAQQPPGEILLYDRRNLQFTSSDRGFLPLIEPGDPLPLDNWASPVDYYDGEFHIRYRIQGPSNQSAGKLQVCIWTMGNEDGDGRDYFPESCSDQVSHQGVGTYENTNVVPSAWWKNDGVPLVFAHPERFLIRVVLRGPDGCNVTNYNVPGACWNLWPQYQDMRFSVTMVMVAPGEQFSGWANYP